MGIAGLILDLGVDHTLTAIYISVNIYIPHQLHLIVRNSERKATNNTRYTFHADAKITP